MTRRTSLLNLPSSSLTIHPRMAVPSSTTQNHFFPCPLSSWTILLTKIKSPSLPLTILPQRSSRQSHTNTSIRSNSLTYLTTVWNRRLLAIQPRSPSRQSQRSSRKNRISTSTNSDSLTYLTMDTNKLPYLTASNLNVRRLLICLVVTSILPLRDLKRSI